MTTPQPATGSPPILADSERGPAWLVGTVWAGMALALFAYIGFFAANLALWDEWQIVPVLTGNMPITLEWLWSPWAEHRLPLTRLLILGLAKISGNDFRAPMFAGALALVVLCAALIVAARRLRGRVSYTDMFLPLLLLEIGHKWNLLEGWNIQNVAVSCLLGLLLFIIVGGRYPLSTTKVWLVGACLLLLPMNGASGLVVLPPLACWLGWHGVRWRASTNGRTGYAALGLALAALLMIPVYLYRLPRYPVPHASFQMSLEGAVMFLSTAWGPATIPLWPASGFLVMAFITYGLMSLLLLWWSRPEERLRSAGLLAIFAAVGILAGVVGWGRMAIGNNVCFESRYGLLAVPALLACYFSALLWRPETAGRFVQLLLLVAMYVMLPLDWQDAWQWGTKHRAACTALERDIRAGVPSDFILMRYGWLIPRWKDTEFSPRNFASVQENMQLLADAGIGIYKDLKEFPPFRKVVLPVVPAGLHDMSWKGQGGYGWGSDPYVEFELDQPQKVYGIMLSCNLNYGNDVPEPVDFQASWKSARRGQWTKSAETHGLDNAKTSKDVVIWVNDTIGGFRLRPDNKPCVLRIARIVLLVEPKDGEPQAPDTVHD